ncbi:MAG: amino acid adenylation domain-containing protein [Reyranella sp.]|nr:amino acid adenylation domain-containing protein [Reyranella sp.]
MEDLWTAFTTVAESQPDAPALVVGEQVTTFRVLKELAEKAQGLLQRHGAVRNRVVAMQLPKRVETYALLLACLRLGAPYVFLDPKSPAPRTVAILDRVRPTVLLSTVTDNNPHGVALPAPDGLSAEAPAELPQVPAKPDEAAYIMFTSGSTGEPKGAVIPHRGVLQLMEWGRRDVMRGRARRFSGLNPLHFDNSVFDIYCGLLNGGTLIPIETGEQSNPASWVRVLRTARAEVVFAVPTLFLILDELGLLSPSTLPDVRTFIFGGEGYPLERLRVFHDRFARQAELINVYGPTETSCICSSILVTAKLMDVASGKFVSLGRMHDAFTYSVGDPRNPVTRGEAGELWIGGPCVGLGYYENSSETDRRFQRIGSIDYYRSGDVVRDVDGLLYFQGRTDNQVKIRGYRIELEEVDAVVEGVQAVQRAVTVALCLGEETELHVAYAGAASREAIAARCRERLPAYMRPSAIVSLGVLPLNANGKVDRLATAKLLEQRAKA